jgi:hypothetical protein
MSCRCAGRRGARHQRAAHRDDHSQAKHESQQSLQGSRSVRYESRSQPSRRLSHGRPDDKRAQSLAESLTYSQTTPSRPIQPPRRARTITASPWRTVSRPSTHTPRRQRRRYTRRGSNCRCVLGACSGTLGGASSKRRTRAAPHQSSRRPTRVVAAAPDRGHERHADPPRACSAHEGAAICGPEPVRRVTASGHEAATQAPSAPHTRPGWKAGVASFFTSDVLFANLAS